MAELQKAMSDSHLSIYDEKNTVNSLKLEYEELLKVEKADVKRIDQLISLSKDIEKSKATTNFRDCRPVSAKKQNPLSKKESEMQKMSNVKVNVNNRSTVSQVVVA